MKICYIANSASSHTQKWALYFAGKGHEVHVISHENTQIPDVKVHYVNYNLKNFFLKKHKVEKILKNIDPDIVHAHQANACGLYAVSIKNYKTIVSAWGSDILVNPNESFLLRNMVKYILKKACYLTSDSQYMTDRMIELGGNKEKISTFPMGVEDSILGYRHDFKDGKIINIISTRRLESNYNIDIIIKGFKLALESNEHLRLHIAADGTEMNDLVNLANELGIADKVVFSGRYSPETVGELLKSNDVFISIPTSDSTSVSLLEAMYCGVYPILSNLPANLEWVKNKENGLIVNEINPQSVEQALLWCTGHYYEILKVSEMNRSIIEKRALWKNNSKIVERLYEGICTKGKK